MKKRFLSFILLCCLMLPCMTLLSACGSHDLNNMVIKNWNNYSYIGAGLVSSPSASGQGVYANSAKKAKAKLFGVTKDGRYEVIKFEDESGKEQEQTYYLSGFTAYTNFTFIEYSERNVEQITSFTSNAEHQYILDNNSGKIYRLDDIFDFINLGTAGCQGESKNAFYCLAKKHSDPYTGHTPIYKFSIENEELKIEKAFDSSKLSAFGSAFIVDNYGNVFSENGKFVISSDGIIKTLDNVSLFKALNGFVYVGNQVFDKDANLVDSTFTPPNLQLSGEMRGFSKDKYLVKQDGSVSYYYIRNRETVGLYKVTFLNDIEYEIEEIELEGYSEDNWKKSLVENDRIYYLSNSEVGYCDIETGKATVLTNEYIFDDIWTDNQGNVCFSALNEYMDSVEGIINADNSITVGITSNGYDVIFVKPIN
mgnify:CR=1 FL=1